VLSCSIGADVLKVAHHDIPDHCVKDRMIALTFDDGPSIKYTHSILDTLNKHGIKAGFHICPNALRKNPFLRKIAKRIIKEGHLLGIRFDPTVHDLSNISKEEFKRLLKREREIVKRELSYDVEYLRLPYGAYPESAVHIAKSLGFVLTEHNLDSKDYENDPSLMLESYKRALRRCGSIISLHRDHSKVTANHLAQVISLVKRANFKFVRLDCCIGKKGY